MVFLNEWLFVVGLVLAFGLGGIGALAPFYKLSNCIALAAPLSGLLLIPCGANFLYALAGISYKLSAFISAGVGFSLSVVALYFRPLHIERRWLLIGVLCFLAISIVAVLTLDAATWKTGGPAIFFRDGTDQSGYAVVADWLNAHLARQIPIASLDRPYERIPAFAFASDPRFGAYGLLALVAALHGTSGIFSYDLACAVVMVTAPLGVAALYAKTPRTLILLVAGLFISHWFDYAGGGYFGKLIAYPGCFLLIAIALRTIEHLSIERVVCVMLFASAVAIMHSGAGTTLLSVPILVVAFIAFATKSERSRLVEPAMVCAIVAILPIFASGILARILVFGFPNYNLTWASELPRLLDLENQGGWLSGFNQAGGAVQCFVALIVWVVLGALALRARSVAAIGLIIGPAVLLFGLVALGVRATAFQMIGYFYPALLCGAALVLESSNDRHLNIPVLSLLALSIIQRVPRFIGAVDRYALHLDARYVFTQREIADIVKKLGGRPVLIDVAEPPQAGVLLLTELGRRNLEMQWTEEAWKTANGNWKWTGLMTNASSAIISLSKERRPGHQFDIVTSAAGRGITSKEAP